MKPIYVKSKTAGMGKCWFCEKKTRMIFDNGIEEYLVCSLCFVRYITNFRKKSQIEEKLRLKFEEKSIYGGGVR